MATIGLAIIVKNEAGVIERCLQSVRPLCDHFLVVDTGSTDGTQDIVRAYLGRHGLSGRVLDMAWRDFAHNRTAALKEMRRETWIDFCMMIDADEQLVYTPPFDAALFRQSLEADVINIETRLDGVRYLRPQLFRNNLDFTFRGVLHEFLALPCAGLTRSVAQGLFNHPSTDGARSRNPEKFADDVHLLRSALANEHDAAMRRRYQFYLAQSLRDAGMAQAALDAYQERATMGGWREEVFVSLYESGKLREALGHCPDDVLLTYLRAHEAVPERAEALVAAAVFCRHQKRFALAYMLSRRALELAPYPEALFAEPAAYAYRARDEAAVSAYWLGHYDECAAWCDELLASGTIPENQRPRIIENRKLALQRFRETQRDKARRPGNETP